MLPDAVDVLLVTGDRDAKGKEWGPTILTFMRETRPLVLIHGGCRGIDKIAEKAAERIGLIGIEEFEAEWEKYERLGNRNMAGPIRNRQMLNRLIEYRDYDKRVHVLAVHPDLSQSRGTKNMVDISEQHGIPITHFTHPLSS